MVLQGPDYLIFDIRFRILVQILVLSVLYDEYGPISSRIMQW